MKRNKHLPLTETTYYILLALFEEAHGYAIMQKVEEMSGGDVRIAAGTMYGAIENLLKQKWIKSIPSDDRRRKVYIITETGKEIVELETNRLRKLLNTANQLGFGEIVMIKFKLFFKSTEKKRKNGSIRFKKVAMLLQALTHFFQHSIILREIKKKTRCQ